MRGHGSPTRLAHIVLRLPDSMSDEDAEKGLRCLIGHALDGHGLRLVSAAEMAMALMEMGGTEGLLDQLEELNEKYGGEVKIDRVMPDDPFGLGSDSEDENFFH